PEELVVAKDNARLVSQLVRDVVAELDERTLAVMRLKYLDELERKEVAAALALSEKQVKKAIERGHKVFADAYAAATAGTMCERRRHALIAYALGSVADRDRRQAEHHIAHCGGCRTFYRAVQVS